MVTMSDVDRVRLINAIAGRRETAHELSTRFNVDVQFLKEFTSANRETIELAAEAIQLSQTNVDGEPDPQSLSDLWISRKFDRLMRLQHVADLLYERITAESDLDGTALREFRSYTYAAANELGQLLHRGSGDAAEGDSVNFEFKGFDMSKAM